MALQTLNTIKQWFKTGLKPSQQQFWDTWDSFRHKYEKVPVKDIEGIDELLLTKADKTVLDNHLADKNAHAPQVNTDWNSKSGFSQLLNKPDFKTVNGDTIVGSGDIVIKEKDFTFQNVLDNENISCTIGTEEEHFKLISKSNAADVDNHIMTFKNSAISAEFQEKGYIYSENGISPIHSLSGANQGYSITNNGLSLKTNSTGGLAHLKSDNITGKQTFQLPNSLTSNSRKTLVSSVNGFNADENGNIILEGQNLQQALENGGSFEANYEGGKQKINAFENGNKSNSFTIETVARGENSSSHFSLESEGSTSLFGTNGNKSSSIAISEGDILLNYSTDNGSTDVKFSTPISNTIIEFPAKPNRMEPYILATTDDITGKNGLNLQKVLENGSKGIVSNGIKIGHNANDYSTWSTIDLKEGDGIDIYSNDVLNIEAKNFYINTTNEGGFISGGDPVLESESFRINSQNARMSIGGGAKGIEIEGQGGSVKISGADNGNGGVEIASRIGIGKIKNIDTNNIEINTGTEKLLYNDIEVATIDRLDAKIDKIEKGVANGLATLGNDGKIPNSQIPALAISETFVVNSQDDMLALSQSEQGDVAVRTDLNKCFILRASPSSTLENWQELIAPSDSVQSVNGQVGNVSLTTAEIQNSTNKNYQTDNQKLFNDATSSIQSQLDLKALDSKVIHKTGNINEFIDGSKIFEDYTYFNSPIILNQSNQTGNTTRPTLSGEEGNIFLFSARSDGSAFGTTLLMNTLTQTRRLNIPNKDGQIALISQTISATETMESPSSKVVYDLDTKNIKTTGFQEINGIKRFTNSTSAQTNGLILVNSGNDINSRVLDVSNISAGVGLFATNSSSGSGIRTENSGIGSGVYSQNSGNGNALNINNTGYGRAILINSNTGNGIEVNCGVSARGLYIIKESSSRGDGIHIQDAGTQNSINILKQPEATGRAISIQHTLGSGISIQTFGYGQGIYVVNSSTGQGISLTNSSTGLGIDISNDDSGQGLRIRNSSNTLSAIGMSVTNYGKGKGVIIYNSNTGDGLYVSNSGLGNAIVLQIKSGNGIYAIGSETGDLIVAEGQQYATGFNFVGKSGGTKTFTVDKFGKIVTNGTISTTGLEVTVSTGLPDDIFAIVPPGSSKTINTSGNIGMGLGNYYLESFKDNNADFGMQRATYFTGIPKGKMYIRVKDTGTWSAWVEK